MGSILAISVGLSLIGWALVIWAAASGKVRIAELRAQVAEQAAKDADARTDTAIALWNDERADHTRDLEAFKAQLDVLKEQALATVAQYRYAFEQLAALVRQARDARDEDDATGQPRTRVM